MITAMASIMERARKHGSKSFTVRRRDPETKRAQGITFDSRGEAGRAGNDVMTAPMTHAGESPAGSNNGSTQDDLDLAADETGREGQGRRLRRQQDEAAEAEQ